MENIMAIVMKNLSKDMEAIEPAANLKIHQTMETCFAKAGGNSDRFAECVLSCQKKVNDIIEPFQFKLLFISKSAEQCLSKNNNDESKCGEEITKLGQNIIKDMIKGL
jgi:hypothetical protein